MQQLRVLTLNIWAHNGPWPARAAAIRAGLIAEQADVVALQEVLGFPGATTQLDELCALLPPELYPHRAYGPACVLPDQRTFGNALLSRFPLINQHTISLPNPRRREPRALLCGLVALPTAQLPVFTTHLDWELDGSPARCQQVRFIADQIDAFIAAAPRPPGSPQPGAAQADVLPAILAGDFNAEPQSDEIRFLTGHHGLAGADGQAPRGVYFSDCYTRALVVEDKCPDDHPSAPGATFARRNPFAARAGEPDRRLDYIFAALPDAHGRCQPLRSFRCFREPHPAGESLATAALRDGAKDDHGNKDGIAPGSTSDSGPDTRTAGNDATGCGGKSNLVWASDHYGVAVDFAI